MIRDDFTASGIIKSHREIDANTSCIANSPLSSSPISQGRVSGLRRLQIKLPTPKKNCMKHEWQAFAYKVWKDYCGIPRELPNMIRFHRQYQKRRDLLDSAYSFCVDYQGAIPKYKMFYWYFWRRYKNLPLAFGS